ncbi:MAG: chain length determinant protein tyrosine kinase EpsG [Sterolibacteriaceae bacterium]|uniref:Chain length determinant protein tyrosine kinase EpsG n=1 Tax=Candidatus Methylophosphatis roskildensis TaxID=2899263 RepID=A0A9D7E6S6_9PROT|nr:chain length determinant protein tyrosine kinase EpsG [Candidatus Methylophosphatis roskildensis]MBK7237456.1 chain length determinant protein tyrosine kinase EpsG [Sterolibacteriaceae bacterium]
MSEERTMPPVEPLVIRSLVRVEKTTANDRSIGAILIDAGRLTLEDAERILRKQKEDGLRFGEAAIKLGLLAEVDIQFALARQFDYPYLVPGESNVSGELVAAYQPFSRQVEALRALRSQLMLRWFNGNLDRRAISIVSTSRNEGRSYLAANLAIVFSQLGERTLLIDADLRNPRQHELFGLPNRAGLSQLVTARADETAIERVPTFMDFSVLTAGSVPPNPQELLSRSSFSNLLGSLVERYDVIILDTPAADQGADAQIVADRAGAALVVARQNHSYVGDLQDLSESLHHAATAIVGVVMNNF